MAGLSQLLLHPPLTPLTFNPDIWLEMALQTPLENDTVDLDGLQAVMLYYEAYRAIGDWRPASVGLVRTAGLVRPASLSLCFQVTDSVRTDGRSVVGAVVGAGCVDESASSDEFKEEIRVSHGDGSSALRALWTRASLPSPFYLPLNPPAQKSFSRRCLSQSISIYAIKLSPSGDPTQGWDAIRSHAYRGLARQAYNAGHADKAIEYFLELPLGSGLSGEEGEEDWLDDFALAWEVRLVFSQCWKETDEVEQNLGDSAERIVDERQLKLQTTIFDANHAVVRLNTRTEDRATFATLESEFCSHLKIVSLPKSALENVAIQGGAFVIPSSRCGS